MADETESARLPAPLNRYAALLRAPAWLVPALAFLFMLAVSWRRWLSPLTDSGREMDLPRRLLEGEMLYRDVHYIYAPLSPYFNALLYRIFGLHLDVLQASGVIFAALFVALSYRIARRLLAPGDAALAVLTVIVWGVFKPYGNLISPYSYAALHATIAALGSLLLALRYMEKRRWADLLPAAALGGLSAVTKLEFAIPAAAALTVAIAVVHRREPRMLATRLTAAALSGAAIAVPVYGWWLKELGWRMLVEDCHLFFTHLPASLVAYNAWRAGTDRPIASLAGIIGACGVWLLAGSLIFALSLRSRNDKEEKNGSDESDDGRAITKSRRMLKWALVAAAVSIGIIALIRIGPFSWDGSPMRAVPIALLVLIVREAWRLRRGESVGEGPSALGREGSGALLVIAVYSLVILARVALRVPSGGPYGGFMLPTSFILFYYLFVRELPRMVERWTGSGSRASRARAFGRGLIVLAIVIAGGDTAIRFRTKYRYEVEAPRGRLRVVRAHDPAYQEALDFLRDHSRPEDAIAVFPEGSDLAFLSGRRMPLRHQILLPDLMSIEDERKAVEQLASEPVRYIFIINRPTREFGSETFGRDYYRALGEAIRRDYRVVKVCGRDRREEIEIGDPEFFIKILERKEATSGER